MEYNVNTKGERMDIDAILEMLRGVKASVDETNTKLDGLRDDMHRIALEQGVLREKVCSLEKSNDGRGARIGDIEKDVAILKNTIDTKEKTKKGMGDNAKWAVGIAVAITSGVLLKVLL